MKKQKYLEVIRKTHYCPKCRTLLESKIKITSEQWNEFLNCRCLAEAKVENDKAHTKLHPIKCPAIIPLE